MSVSVTPQHQDELMSAIRKLIEWYCGCEWANNQKIDVSRGMVFFDLLQKEAFDHSDLLLGEIPSAAQRYCN
jgi:hypothetical protein